ncbi:MAG: hypothetical protein PHQ89_03950 [Bacilli bacterium]|nr:hypothetical protein [Bacilli bacterium]
MKESDYMEQCNNFIFYSIDAKAHELAIEFLKKENLENMSSAYYFEKNMTLVSSFRKLLEENNVY